MPSAHSSATFARIMHRLFVGLRPPSPMRAQLLGLMGGVAGARWQDDGQLHITLKYIGEVDAARADDIAAALEILTAAPLTLALDGIGTFDKKSIAHSLWAGVTPHDAVTALHHKVDQACLRAGIPADPRAYLPHITLARLNRASGPLDSFIAAQGSLTSPPALFDHFILYESHLGRGGSFYEPVARYGLG